MPSVFRPAVGSYTTSAVLAELARLWEQAVHRAAAGGGTVTQKRLALDAGVPYTTVNSWATGTSLPWNLDQIIKVGKVLADWAGEEPSPNTVWRQWLRVDRTTRNAPSMSPVGADTWPGRPLEHVVDPFLLEVHRSIDAEGEGPEVEALPVLPLYVPRAHDERLAQVVKRTAEGASAMAVLVGGSSTGKTRACWEALAILRERSGWRLWHPFDPTLPEAALAGLTSVGPRTVVWLNETQRYLDAPGDLGERVAAALRTLLADPGRAPVLILGTLWPEHWDALTRTGRPPDRHAQARTVLTGTDITMEAGFTGAAREALHRAAASDVRVAAAVTNAADGEITQYLAGVPELLNRYHNAPPAARAVIEAAMDAHCLGWRYGLPHALLKAAAPAYLSAAEWKAVRRAAGKKGKKWLKQALDYTATPCKGVAGPVTQLWPRTPPSPTHRARTFPEKAADRRTLPGERLYQLAEPLKQYGRHHRQDQTPPAGFWNALAVHAHPDDLVALGDAARTRHLLRIAAQFYKRAAFHNPYAAVWLIRILRDLHPTDQRPVTWAATHVCADEPVAMADMVDSLRMGGHREQLGVLARRAAAQVSMDNMTGVAFLVERLRWAGEEEQVAVLARRAVTHIALDDPRAVARLLDKLREVEAGEQIEMLLARDPAAHVSLDAPDAPPKVAHLVDSLRLVEADAQLAVLARRAAAYAPLSTPEYTEIFTSPHIWGLVPDPVDGSTEYEVRPVVRPEQTAEEVVLEDSWAVTKLLERLKLMGSEEQIAALLARDPAAHVSLDDLDVLSDLLKNLWLLRAVEQAAVLAQRVVAHAPLDDPGAVAKLLKFLRLMGAGKQVALLLARDPAAHVSLADIFAVTALCTKLYEVGADAQVKRLLGPLSTAQPPGVSAEENDGRTLFRFGRQPDGAPAGPWGWDDLS